MRPDEVDALLAALPTPTMPAEVAQRIDLALAEVARATPPEGSDVTDDGPDAGDGPALGVTTLPQVRPLVRQPWWRAHPQAVGLAAGLALIAAVAIPIAATSGGSRSSNSSTAAATGGRAAVIADSGHALADPIGVRAEVKDLLAGRLPRADLAASAGSALSAPQAAPEGRSDASAPTAGAPAAPSAPGAGSGGVASGPPTELGPGLSLQDPALGACLASITDGAPLLGVDRVVYAGQPSLIVVTTGESGDVAYVIGPGCAALGATGLRTVVTVPRAG